MDDLDALLDDFEPIPMTRSSRKKPDILQFLDDSDDSINEEVPPLKSSNPGFLKNSRPSTRGSRNTAKVEYGDDFDEVVDATDVPKPINMNETYQAELTFTKSNSRSAFSKSRNRENYHKEKSPLEMGPIRSQSPVLSPNSRHKAQPQSHSHSNSRSRSEYSPNSQNTPTREYSNVELPPSQSQASRRSTQSQSNNHNNQSENSMTRVSTMNLTQDQLISLLKEHLQSDDAEFKRNLQREVGLTQQVSGGKPPLPRPSASRMTDDQSTNNNNDVQYKIINRPSTAPNSNRKRNTSTPNKNQKSKIGSLTSHNLLRSSNDFSKFEQSTDFQNPEFIKQKRYLDWLSKKEREIKKKKKAQLMEVTEQTATEEEKEAEKRAEANLAMKAWLAKKKPILLQKQKEKAKKEQDEKEAHLEKEAEREINRRHIEKYREKRAKEQDERIKLKRKEERQAKQKELEDKEKRMAECKTASRRWRDKKTQELKSKAKERRNSIKSKDVIESAQKEEKSKNGQEAYARWMESKEKQEKVNKVIRKFRKEMKLEGLDDSEENAPCWKHSNTFQARGK